MSKLTDTLQNLRVFIDASQDAKSDCLLGSSSKMPCFQKPHDVTMSCDFCVFSINNKIERDEIIKILDRDITRTKAKEIIAPTEGQQHVKNIP